ncbi:hypothetical protein B0H11DRAFT_2040948 [Mycena galericulata]|nr:hypothetical protein B0H11DRAFT_2040948 [Mycena galericulata]
MPESFINVSAILVSTAKVSFLRGIYGASLNPLVISAIETAAAKRLDIYKKLGWATLYLFIVEWLHRSIPRSLLTSYCISTIRQWISTDDSLRLLMTTLGYRWLGRNHSSFATAFYRYLGCLYCMQSQDSAHDWLDGLFSPVGRELINRSTTFLRRAAAGAFPSPTAPTASDDPDGVALFLHEQHRRDRAAAAHAQAGPGPLENDYETLRLLRQIRQRQHPSCSQSESRSTLATASSSNKENVRLGPIRSIPRQHPRNHNLPYARPSKSTKNII